MIHMSIKSLVSSIALSAACVFPAHAASFADLAFKDTPQRHEQLVERARREGSLTLYTSIPSKDMAVLTADFEKRYGVHVNVWRASTLKVVQRMVAEKKAGQWNFDVVDISSPELEALYREGLLQQVDSKLHATLLEDAMPSHRGWAPQFITLFVQAYNTNAIKEADLPKTYADLRDPKWRGQLGVEASDGDWYCGQVEHLGQEQGKQLFDDIVRTNKWSVRSGHSLLANMVVSGEVPIGLTTYSYMIDQAKRQGAPVDWFAIDPIIARTNGIAVSRQPANPHAALLFYEYMISDAQPLILKMDYYSPVKKLASSPKGASIRFVDPLMDRAEIERCNQAFMQLNKLSN
ncbi:extracellular solute-binding protein [Pusillimonas caeni]|nr:extracellular solute-binding protein [Pusillimonas caeni]